MHPETAGSSPPAAKGGQGNPVDPARARSSFAKLDWLIVLILFSLGFCGAAADPGPGLVDRRPIQALV